MVQKYTVPSKASADAKPKRGRPRSYEPGVALGKALDAFRKNGYAATSLDELSAATGMNRPSLYGAFGDKRDLYIAAYQRYSADARTLMAEIFSAEMPLRRRLQRIFTAALNTYLSGDEGPRGCFTVTSAASDAIADPEIRQLVLDALAELDKAFVACFRLAKEAGELRATADPQALAQLASATLHTVAIRARARVPRRELDAVLRGSLDILCGRPATRRG